MATKTKKPLAGAALVAVSKKRRTVEVKDGDKVLETLYVRKMSAHQMHKMLSGRSKEELEKDDTVMFDFVATCIVDDDGGTVFTRDVVAELSSDIYGQLANAVREHLRLGEDLEGGKDSKAKTASA